VARCGGVKPWLEAAQAALRRRFRMWTTPIRPRILCYTTLALSSWCPWPVGVPSRPSMAPWPDQVAVLPASGCSPARRYWHPALPVR